MGPRPLAPRCLLAALACVTALICAPGSAAAHTLTLPCNREQLPPKPGGGTWSCTFDDEFDASTGDATVLSRKWVPQLTANSGFMTGGLGGSACYVNSPANIAVSEGALQLTARREAAPINCAGTQTQYTAGMVSTYKTFSQTYGRFEVRARLPQVTVPGLQETLWLWPSDATRYGWWPASGEIDFSEFYSQYAGFDVPYIHYNTALLQFDPATVTNVQTASCPIVLSQYNDYVLVWSPGQLTITVNGTTCLVDNYIPAWGLTSPQPFDQPFFVLLTQALGSGANAFNPELTPLPATTSIDYVRVWK